MNMQGQIKEYIATQPEPKQSELQQLHHIILALMPACKFGSWMEKTRKEKPFPIQTLDMDLKP